MKSPILIFTLALCVFLLSAFSGGKHKHKPKAKPKPKHAVAAVIPTNKSVCSFNLQFTGGKGAQNFVSTDVKFKDGGNGYFDMVANYSGGKKFEISYFSSDKAPTPRHQLMRATNVKSKYYIRFTQADHSELYFSGYDLNFINTKDGIRGDIKLMTAGHNTMQQLHVLLLKGK